MADILGGATGALGGAAAGAKIGSIVPGIGTAVGAVVGGLAGLFSGGKKQSKVTYQPLDIAKIISDARTQAAENYRQSFELERQVNPQQAALRGQTNIALSNLASGNTPGVQASYRLLDQALTGPIANAESGTNSLLEESASRILNNLRLGGALGADAQQQAVKAALEKAGTSGISGSGAARGLVARDLGLTSMAVENQRIGQAQQAGAQQAQLGLAREQLRLQDFLGRSGLAQNVAAQDAQRTGLLASIVDARALPEPGLNPGAIASLYVADNNARNQVGTTNAAIAQQQRNQNLNSLLGLGSMAAGGGFDALSGLFKRPGTSSGTNLDAILAGATGSP